MSVHWQHAPARQVLASVLSGTLLWCSPVLSHEFWLQPENFVLRVGESFRVALKNGERLDGASFPYLPDRFERFDVIDAAGARSVQGRLGDDPAAVIDARVPGLMTLVYQSTPNQLVYADWAAFERFTEEEDVAWLLDAHRKRGFPQQNVIEQFFRYSKLVTWASDQVSEHSEAPAENTAVVAGQALASNTALNGASGLRLELVLHSNPYLRSADEPVDVQLLFEGQPLADTQISVFHRAESGTVTVERLRVDNDGQLQLQAASEGWYLLSAVMVEASTPAVMLDTGAVWQSLWASMVFGPSLHSAAH